MDTLLLPQEKSDEELDLMLSVEAALGFSTLVGVIDLTSTKCHECTLADYRIGSHKHCGTCYCCRPR